MAEDRRRCQQWSPTTLAVPPAQVTGKGIRTYVLQMNIMLSRFPKTLTLIKTQPHQIKQSKTAAVHNNSRTQLHLPMPLDFGGLACDRPLSRTSSKQPLRSAMGQRGPWSLSWTLYKGRQVVVGHVMMTQPTSSRNRRCR